MNARKKNERLAFFKSRIVNHQPDTLKNLDTLDGRTISYQNADKLNYRVTILLSSCSDYDGDIQFKDDSLFLIYSDLSDKTCTEQVLYELTYTVLNKERKQYKHEVMRK
jgi:hypothetical protein